jgi:hypothetical protein
VLEAVALLGAITWYARCRGSRRLQCRVADGCGRPLPASARKKSGEKQRLHAGAERVLREQRMGSGHGHAKVVDGDAPRCVVAERVEELGEPDDASVARDDATAHVPDPDGLAGLDRDGLEDRPLD